MESADPTKTTTHPAVGHEGHGVHLCSRCGWPFPNPHPSARHRRKHKRVCGTVEGYTLVSDSGAASLSHSHSQHSAVSSFSDDEHGSDGDSKAPSAKGVISVSQGGSGRVLERKNMSADDVFADAVSEFADASTGLGGDEGLSINAETVSHKGFGIPSFTPPAGNVAVTGGNVQASFSQKDSNKSTQDATESGPNQEQVTSLSEIPAKVDDAFTDTIDKNKKSDAFDEPNGHKTDLSMIGDPSGVNAAPVIVPVSKDASESREAVTEERTTKDLPVAKSLICQYEETHDTKSVSETFMDDHFQEGETLLRSNDEISQTKFDELLTDLAAEGSVSNSPVIIEVIDVPSSPKSDTVGLVNNQVVESSCEIEGDISVDRNGAPPTAAEIEAAHTGIVLGSEDSNEKDVNSLTRASMENDTRAISMTDENGQVGSIAGNNIGIMAEDLVTKAEGNVSENVTKSDSLSLNISSAEPVSMSPIVLVHSVETTSETAPVQIDGQVTSLHEDRDVQLSSDVKLPLGSNFIEDSTEISKEVKLDDAEASDLVIETKPVSHDVLLQKLEEDLSDDEPVTSFPATESSSQSLGNNLVHDGGVFCKDSSSKCVEEPQDLEKGAAALVADAPYEISSPNGSSLDGNWGSVSVLSTMSDPAGDGKKMKETQDGQPQDNNDMFDPPSLMTLIEPQAQKAAAAPSTCGEVHNPQQTEAAKAAWFPSISNVSNESHGRKKNEEIIAKVTNWSTGKQHSPLKTLLGEAKANSSNSDPSAAVLKDKTALKNGTPVPMVNSVLGSEESDHPKDKLDSSSTEWSPTARYPDEIKREKRKAKGKPYWVPFMCCSSVK